jgi:uncharacterized sporulation protein YeaH/YhbH (DUF444 family)
LNIVDRRLNPRGKSLANRQRFMRRARKQILDAVREASAKGDIADIGGDRIRITADGLHEPTFQHSQSGGERTIVAPGNKDYVKGDRLPRPTGGSGRGGREGAPDGEGQDAFHFVLSQEEFLDLFFDDLELPDLLRKQLKLVDGVKPVRAGYSVSGNVANLAIVRTMRNSLARRIALRRPSLSDIDARQAEIDELEPQDEDQREALTDALHDQQRRSKRIPFIDPIDIRYNRFTTVPQPVASAVMFCLMDVSGSMTEHMKDLAKRFYKLLYLFLTRRYRHVEMVFIRHTHLAREVDETTFFTSTESGGTVVSTALDEMQRILSTRYPREQWNVYAAQASDGDNMPGDNARATSLLARVILPVCQYFAYLEVGSEHAEQHGVTELWRAYEKVVQAGHPMAMRRVNHRSQIYPVFRELFSRDREARKELPV